MNDLLPSLLSSLANVIVVIHAIFVFFVVGGQILILIGWFRKWLWTRNFYFRIIHIASIGYVVLEAWLGITCPLTLLEHYLRTLAGQTIPDMNFIIYWIHYFLFYTAPTWVFTLIYSIFGSMVLFTYFVYPPHRISSKIK